MMKTFTLILCLLLLFVVIYHWNGHGKVCTFQRVCCVDGSDRILSPTAMGMHGVEAALSCSFTAPRSDTRGGWRRSRILCLL